MSLPSGIATGALLLLGAGGLLVVGLGPRGRSSAARPAPPPVKPTATPAAAPLRAELEPAAPRELFPTPPALAESQVDDPPPAVSAPERDAATEAQHLARFLARGAALGEDAADLLRGDGPAAEKVALLRAAHELALPACAELHLLALRELPDVSSPQGESVPSTALLLLARRAATDAEARDVLARAAFEVPYPAPALRRRAAVQFLLVATEDELARTAPMLGRETDEAFLAAALEALSRNPHPGAAAPILAARGWVPAEGLPADETQER